jgi:hypothetical protein
VPALELFARFDANNPPPPGWDLWGNQAAQASDATDDTSSPDESPRPDAERLWLHPAIAGKHVISMTRDYLDGEAIKRATCQCGWKTYARAGIERPIDDQINGHWRARILASEAFEPDDEGRDRFRELGGELKARKPAPAIEPHPLDVPAFLRRTVKGQFEMDLSTSDRAPPEVVDGRLQTRLPLTESELEEQAALLALKAEKKIDSEMLRHLVGRDFAWCTPSGRVHITDSGHAFLAQLVTPAPAAGA